MGMGFVVVVPRKSPKCCKDVRGERWWEDRGKWDLCKRTEIN